LDLVSRSSAFEDWLNEFVRDSLTEEAIAAFAETVDAEIIQALPEFGSDPVLVDDLRRSTRHQWIAFLHGLRNPEHGLKLPVEALDLARSLARRSKDVKVLLRVYLSAHRGVFSYLTESIDRLGGGELGSDHILRELWKRADLWMDESIESLIETFFEERQRELDGSAARRAELVGVILAGDDIDEAEASAELAYPFEAWHTSFLVWTSRADARTTASLRSAADAVAKCFPAARLLTEVAGSRDLRGWVATRTPPPAEAFEQFRSLDISDVNIAIGVPAAGQDGFRSSHADARATQSLAMASRAAPRFLDYRSVEILSLALADRDALVRMVRREVGPLCGSDKNLDPVRETVLTYLTNRMNVEATADRLYVHGNTVRYRLAKAEELLGCQLAERPRQIELALQYVAHLGAPE
jgi:DNA-binding PucR family transcriptional regulator